jgi:hypothetical protein
LEKIMRRVLAAIFNTMAVGDATTLLLYLIFGITILIVFLAFDDAIGVSGQVVDDAV